jgi:hypothetical protein
MMLFLIQGQNDVVDFNLIKKNKSLLHITTGKKRIEYAFVVTTSTSAYIVSHLPHN